MLPRLAPALVGSLVLLAVAACGTAAAPADPATPGPVVLAPDERPHATPVPWLEMEPSPTPSGNAGDVDGWGGGPELTVEFPRDGRVDVTLEDADAKAWRLVVQGTGALAADRLEIVVEASDPWPLITVTEIQQGRVTDVMDLSGFDETAAAGGCHRTLNVCIDSSWFRLPTDGDGRFAIRLEMPGPGTSLLVTGGTAGWPDEPNVLGPWSDTESFPWGDA